MAPPDPADDLTRLLHEFRQLGTERRLVILPGAPRGGAFVDLTGTMGFGEFYDLIVAAGARRLWIATETFIPGPVTAPAGAARLDAQLQQAQRTAQGGLRGAFGRRRHVQQTFDELRAVHQALCRESARYDGHLRSLRVTVVLDGIQNVWQTHASWYEDLARLQERLNTLTYVCLGDGDWWTY